MVGLGTQDSLGEAHDFVNDFDLTFEMLWDESFITWEVIGVSSQPAAIMLQPDGTPITGWLGPFPEDEVLQLAAEYAG